MHSVGVTPKGEVFTWGDGAHGALGHGTSSRAMKPRHVKSLVGKVATDACCGSYHTSVVTREGELFTW
jgi:alpha-tubulin suppressor-like RCC1 family protein